MFTFSVCFLNYPVTVLRKEEIKSEPASGEAGCFSLFKKKNFPKCESVFPQIPVKFGQQRFWSLWYCVRGGQSISDVYSSSYLFPCVHNAFQSANLYMYIQAMFTEKYLHWCRLTCSQLFLLQMTWQSDCDISHIMCLILHTVRFTGQSMLSDLKCFPFIQES